MRSDGLLSQNLLVEKKTRRTDLTGYAWLSLDATCGTKCDEFLIA